MIACYCKPASVNGELATGRMPFAGDAGGKVNRLDVYAFSFRKKFFFCGAFLLLLSFGTPLFAQDSDGNTEAVPFEGESGSSLPAQEERKTSNNLFGVMAHRPNYVLPFTWNSTLNHAYDDSLGGESDHAEVHFQISIKVPLFRGFWDGKGSVFLAYTNRSWWQAYNREASSPFRETNHEPELFLDYALDWRLSENIRLANLSFGINHQSNGKGGDESRSWNRIYLDMLWELGDQFALSFKPWYRIPEDGKNSPEDPSGDDNPDIHNYMGYGELALVYKFGKNKDQTLGVMFRNNLRFSGENRGAVQVDWIFPIFDRVNLYVQYFNGYGESLIDYDASVNRIGVGFLAF